MNQEQNPRAAEVERITKETRVQVALKLDGSGEVDVVTGLGFLDHMIHALAFHAGFDLRLRCEGDLQVDDHHSAEDCALALGEALDRSLGGRSGIVRFGSAYAPLDEALSRCVLDLSGRPFASVRLQFQRERLGTVATENLTHFLESLAVASRSTLHVEVLEGRNDHHKAESAFKATALALREAVTPRAGAVPSTKGSLG